MANLIQDFRFALRTLRKSPVFTLVAVASLALGIGANTAIFTLVNQLLLKMLPVKAPEELVLLDSHGSHYGSNTGSNAMSYPMYQDIRDRNQVFSGMFCRYGQTFAFGDNGKTQVISGELVSGNYFPVLGIGAAAGRVFSVSDDLMQHGHPVAVISYDFWRSQFALDPSAINRKITLNGYPFTIIGVSLEGFHGIDPSLSPANPDSHEHEGGDHARPVVFAERPPEPFCQCLRPTQAGHDHRARQSWLAAALPFDSRYGGQGKGLRQGH